MTQRISVHKRHSSHPNAHVLHCLIYRVYHSHMKLVYHMMRLHIETWWLTAGINSIMFYAPVIFKTISSNGALLSTVITGVINVATTFVSIALVDKIGRKVLCTA